MFLSSILHMTLSAVPPLIQVNTGCTIIHARSTVTTNMFRSGKKYDTPGTSSNLFDFLLKQVLRGSICDQRANCHITWTHIHACIYYSIRRSNDIS